MLAKSDERVDLYCKYIFTLVCGGFQELTKSQEFIDSFDVKEQELEEFRYRGFGNPGRMYIKTKDQREFDKDYNSFGVTKVIGKFHLDAKYAPMQLEKVLILQL